MAVEQDWQAFQRALPALLAEQGNRGKYALVHDEVIDSIWANFEEALTAGYEQFGIDSFLVQPIVEKEKPRYFSRNLQPWPSSPAASPTTEH